MSNTQQIVVFPRGQLTPKDKERLTKSGVIAIEAETPRDVVCLVPNAGNIISGDVFTKALLHAVKESSTMKTAYDFAQKLSKLLAEAENE